MCECALHLWTKVPEVLGRFESRYMGCGGNSATSGNNPSASHFFYTFHHSSHAKSIPAKQTCPATTLVGSRPFRQFPIQSLGINLEDLSSLFAVAPGFF